MTHQGNQKIEVYNFFFFFLSPRRKNKKKNHCLLSKEESLNLGMMMNSKIQGGEKTTTPTNQSNKRTKEK